MTPFSPIQIVYIGVIFILRDMKKVVKSWFNVEKKPHPKNLFSNDQEETWLNQIKLNAVLFVWWLKSTTVGRVTLFVLMLLAASSVFIYKNT